MWCLEFSVTGRPAPQGSKRYIGGSAKQGGRFIEASKFLAPWRKLVTEHAIYALCESSWPKATGPVELEVTFYLERPATVSKATRPWPIKPPDTDKLLRGVNDALTDAEVWDDDSQVVKVTAWKCYADTREPGCVIKVTPIQ